MKKKTAIIVLAELIFIAGAVALLGYNGVILLNNPSLEDYPVRGIDVSSFQGETDWDIIAEQNIQFAFIKLPRAVVL